MAKVTGPLQSFSAAGKVADSLIFQTHTGRNVVRRYFRPRVANTREQVNSRHFLRFVSEGNNAITPGLPYLNDLLTVVPNTQNWASYMQVLANRRYGTATAGLLAWDRDFNRHPNRVLINDFARRIDFIGFEFDDGTQPDQIINPGALFFFIAEVAFEIRATTNLFRRPVYETPLDSWNLNHATEFKQDFTSRIPAPP